MCRSSSTISLDVQTLDCCSWVQEFHLHELLFHMAQKVLRLRVQYMLVTYCSSIRLPRFWYQQQRQHADTYNSSFWDLSARCLAQERGCSVIFQYHHPTRIMDQVQTGAQFVESRSVFNLLQPGALAGTPGRDPGGARCSHCD